MPATEITISTNNVTVGPASAPQEVHDPVERELVRVTAGINAKIQNLFGRGTGTNTGTQHPTGIKFQGTATNALVKGCKMVGFAMAVVLGTYRQGDGFATELANSGVSFVGDTAEDCGDGGFDLKGPDATVDKCDAKGCAHSLRLWSTCWIKSFWSRFPCLAPGVSGDPLHVHICPAVEHTVQQVYRFDFLYARGPGVLLFVEIKPGAIPPKIVFLKHDVRGVTEILRTSGGEPEIDWGPQGPPVL